MKTFFFAASLALASLTAIANNAAAVKKINVNVTRAFENEFGRVADVSWTTAGNKLIRANFTKDGEALSAFFSESGDYVATTISRTVDEIPAKLRSAIAAKEKDGVIVEALEYQDNDDTCYFIRVYVNGSEKLYRGTNLGGLELTKF